MSLAHEPSSKPNTVEWQAYKSVHQSKLLPGGRKIVPGVKNRITSREKKQHGLTHSELPQSEGFSRISSTSMFRSCPDYDVMPGALMAELLLFDAGGSNVGIAF